MQNRLDFPAPNEDLACTKELAYDLAFGAFKKLWSGTLTELISENPFRHFIVNYHDNEKGDDVLQQYLVAKWTEKHPTLYEMEKIGYADYQATDGINRTYTLTQEAYDLLKSNEYTDTKVFISYCHETSSAFALLLEARLAAIGIKAFIDRSIPAGDEWHAHLKGVIEGCRIFLCLITNEALESSYIRDEIQWASHSLRIPVWHPNFKYDKENTKHPDWLKEFVTYKQAIRVYEESGKAYHSALEEIINAVTLGIS